MPRVPFLPVLLVLLALALVSGFRPVYLVFYAAVGVAVLGYLWAWLQTRGMEVRVQLLSQQPEVGKPVYFRAIIRERLGVPRIWLRARLALDVAAMAEETVALGPRRDVSWTTAAVCTRRGLHKFGTLTLAGQDPFGLTRVERDLGEAPPTVIYPETVQVPSEGPGGYFGQESGGHALGGLSARQMDPTPATVREYLPGDPMTGIHWPSTARLGQLMMKQSQEVKTAEVWLLIDLQEAVQASSGTKSTEEYIVTIAASLAKHFIASGQSVGLIFQGDNPCRIAPRKGSQQLDQLLTALALVRARGRVPLATIITREMARFQSGALAIAVQPTTGNSPTDVFASLARQGVAVVPVQLDSSTFADQPHAGATVRETLAGARASRVIREGDDLGVLLGGLLKSVTA